MNSTHLNESAGSKAAGADGLGDLLERAKRLHAATTHEEVAELMRESVGLGVVDLDDGDPSDCDLDAAKAAVLEILEDEALAAGMTEEELTGHWWEKKPG